MTPESVLLALIAALLLAVLIVFWRLTNARGTVTWEVRTTQPEPGNAEVEEARRRVAEMAEARRLLDERAEELLRHERKTMGDV